MIESRLTGLDDLERALRELPESIRRRKLRAALAAGGRIVRDAAKGAAPVLRRAVRHRTPGLLRDRVAVRTSKRDAATAGQVGIFINVRPAKGAARGANSKGDPYYWRFVEFGRRAGVTKRRQAGGVVSTGLLNRRRTVRVGAMPAAGFLARSSAQLPAALAASERSLGRQIKALNGRRPSA